MQTFLENGFVTDSTIQRTKARVRSFRLVLHNEEIGRAALAGELRKHLNIVLDHDIRFLKAYKRLL